MFCYLLCPFVASCFVEDERSFFESVEKSHRISFYFLLLSGTFLCLLRLSPGKERDGGERDDKNRRDKECFLTEIIYFLYSNYEG